MKRWHCFPALVLLTVLAVGRPAHAEGNGQSDFDDALRAKVNAQSLRDLNSVIELLESALDKGLDVENSDMAEQMLAQTLLERGGQLTLVVRNIPPQNAGDPQIAKVRDLAVSDMRRVLTYDNPPPQATIMLAQLLAMTGDGQAESLELLTQLMEDAAFVELPAEDQVEAHVVRADVLRQQEKFDDALASLEKAIELDPEQPEAYQERGEIYRAQASELGASGDADGVKAKLDAAIAQFDRVLELQPGALLTLIHRAEARLINEQADKALEDIEAVLKDNPGLSLAHGLRAQALANQDRLPEAIEEMKLLADAAPNEAEFGMQLALFYLINDQPRQAIEAYTTVLKHDGENFMALRGRADAYLNVGDHAAAIADFTRAISLRPDDTGVLNNFAWVLATSPDDPLRDGKRAIEYATKAVELTDQKQSHILSTLAAAYAETGDFDKAREWSQKAVDMNDEEHLEQLKQELESYKQDKPWREKQTAEEPKVEADVPAEAPAEPPAEAPTESPAGSTEAAVDPK